jgi:hypothetical protein
MSRVTALALLALLGCGGPQVVAVQLLVPDLNGTETPLPGIEIAALPYDRDSVLAALEHRAPTGRPHTQELDSLFQAFRAPFLAFSRVAWRVEQLSRRRDSLRLVQSPGGAPGALELTRWLDQVSDSLRRLAPDLTRTRSILDRARDTLWPRIARLQSEVRGWEHSAYSGYDTIVRGFARDRLRLGVADTTDANGWAKLQLSAGRWWIYARSPDPQDPNAQWYWNVPAGGDTLRLDPRTARHLPRY